MALLKDISIKWKLSLSLIATGLILVSSYVYLAKNVFENDKISYVFEAQGARLESSKNEINSKLQRTILASRSLIATFDPALGKASPTGESLFNEEKALIAIELWSEEKQQSLMRLEKKASLLPPSYQDKEIFGLNQIHLSSLGNNFFLMTFRYSQKGQGVLRLHTVLDWTEIKPQLRINESLAMLKGKEILAIMDQRGLDKSLFLEIAEAIDLESSEERTKIWNFGSDRFLLSEVSLGIANLKMIAVTPEVEALGALGTLFNRSLIFLFLSLFGLVIVSLVLSRGLTSDLRLLTASAKSIGSGNFNILPSVKSNDEMGILSSAFTVMTQEIKRLLVETEEKTRMEQELNTAKLVQERLLPIQPEAAFGEIEISGRIVTASECGGDWWYYFKQDDELYFTIADATGHGTPAALITASARAIFSRIENEKMTLSDMLKVWDHAVLSCSQKEVMMTAILFKININTGEGAFVNAAHEVPWIFRLKNDGTYLNDTLVSDATTRIGDNIQLAKEQKFKLEPNESLLLYTDGLFSVTREDGKTLSEKRFGKKIADRLSFVSTAHELTNVALKEFNDYRGNIPLPDDVSLVSVRRRGPKIETILESDSGGFVAV